jgi:putative dimethyl sulfoxide reductase chaperone
MADIEIEEFETEADDAAEVSELIALLEQRNATYGLLSRLYIKEFDQELLDEMHEMLYPVETGERDTNEGYLLIATYLSNLWSESLEELRIDFSRCFFGDGVDAFSAAYPYESVYTSEKRLMMEKARFEVLAIYRAHGMKKHDSWHEGEDHIALEMEFERHMGERTIEALRAGDEDKAQKLLKVQYDFVKKHLVSWAPMMTADLKRFAQTKMYRGLAYLTDGFLKTDRQFLKDLLFDEENAEQAAGEEQEESEHPTAQPVAQ